MNGAWLQPPGLWTCPVPPSAPGPAWNTDKMNWCWILYYFPLNTKSVSIMLICKSWKNIFLSRKILQGPEIIVSAWDILNVLIDFHHQPALWTIAAQPSAINYNNTRRYAIKSQVISNKHDGLLFWGFYEYTENNKYLLTLILLMFCSLVPGFSHQKGGSIPTKYACHLKNNPSIFLIQLLGNILFSVFCLFCEKLLTLFSFKSGKNVFYWWDYYY